MVKNSVGLIEVVGLAAAMTAADAAVKAANIELVGYELAKGGGQVLVKLCGDVGAVKAGVQAGSVAAAKVGKVVATFVIPRPHPQIACIWDSKETVGVKEHQLELPPDAKMELDVEVGEDAAEQEETAEPIEIDPLEMPQSDGCNLCNDPECPRKKGDPKITCIHYGKKR